LGEALLALRAGLGGVDLTEPARRQVPADWRRVMAGDDDDDEHLRL